VSFAGITRRLTIGIPNFITAVAANHCEPAGDDAVRRPVYSRPFCGSLGEGAVPAGGLNLNYNVGSQRPWLCDQPGGDLATLTIIAPGSSICTSSRTRCLACGQAHRSTATRSLWRAAVSSANGSPPQILSGKERIRIYRGVCHVNHREVNGATAFNSQALYVQLAYRLPWV